MYRVFTRTWWIANPAWPGGREPGAGKRRTIRKNVKTIEEARAICKAWNATHDPGFLSKKAEFEEQ
jgi:hypothetical protein